MTHVQKGIIIRAPQWRKHQRDWKRIFRKREHKAKTALGRRNAAQR
jgi:hypothetical protein